MPSPSPALPPSPPPRRLPAPPPPARCTPPPLPTTLNGGGIFTGRFRIRVNWKGNGDDVWFDGSIAEYRMKQVRARGGGKRAKHEHRIAYDDGEKKWHELGDKDETWCLVSPSTASR